MTAIAYVALLLIAFAAGHVTGWRRRGNAERDLRLGLRERMRLDRARGRR